LVSDDELDRINPTEHGARRGEIDGTSRGVALQNVLDGANPPIRPSSTSHTRSYTSPIPVPRQISERKQLAA
jgi:hypothetical protein